MTHIDSILRQFDACPEALSYGARYKVEDDQRAWDECVRGDWMLWWLGQFAGPPESEGRKKLVMCTCDCAALALKYTTDGRVEACIETARKWARGEATIDELKSARRSADDVAIVAAHAADAAAFVCAVAYAGGVAGSAYAVADAAAAADAAADAVDAAYAVADAAGVVTAVAYGVADAAGVVTAVAYGVKARKEALKKCADIVRQPQHYPRPPKP